MGKEYDLIVQSLNNVQQYIKMQAFKGYDPYDTLLSPIPFHWLGKWGPILATQFQKRNPVNIRSLLWIKKDINPKAFGLFLHTYILLYKATSKEEYLEKAHFFFNWLKDNNSKGYSGYCWGYNFPWAGPDKYVQPFVPSSVVSGIIGKGIIEYYKTTKNPKAIEVLEGICDFLINELEITRDNSGICISYTPLERDCCYNASLLSAEITSFIAKIKNDNYLKKYTKDALDYVIHRQKKDGRWNYSINLKTGKEREQVDFHQGYVLESIFHISKNLGLNDEKKYQDSIRKGLDFYYKEQFFQDGRSKWRIPKIWPIDIHNQAQGIITFTLLQNYCSNYLGFAKRIAVWTIKNMQDKNTGHFYYKNYKYYKHKTPYMRWSQAWMFLALTYLIISVES